jgi:class 3 adenylate cyclase
VRLVAEVDLSVLLDAAEEHVADELDRMPEVDDKGHDLDVDELPETERVWHRVEDVVAVVADLKSSTYLGLNKNARSTASIYEAATGNVATLLDEFGSEFVAIQGDGAFGLFWGEGRKRRAVCAAITIKTFSEKALVPRLEKKWTDLPETGLKIGIANSPLLVKRIGLAGSDGHEPVWAGRAVNYAAKCAQQADRGELIVTGSIWDWIAKNDFLAASCDCSEPSTKIWSDTTIDRIPDRGDGEREGKTLHSAWCAVHGDEYCNAVLSGKRSRSGVETKTARALESEWESSVRLTAHRRRIAVAKERDLANAMAKQSRDQGAHRSGFHRGRR